MLTIQGLSGDNLVALVTGNFVRADILNAANLEILKRLNASPESDDSQEEAFKNFKEDVYYKIKDLHDRYDQVCKKLVELEENERDRYIIKPGVVQWADNEMICFAAFCGKASPSKSILGCLEEFKKTVK